MTDEQNATPVQSTTDDTNGGASGSAAPPNAAPTSDGVAAPQTDPAPPAQSAPPQPASIPEDPAYDERLERLGGEPAPVITPEEFARLQRMGQVNIDARGRVRTTRRSDAEAGVSLRKRRAWYA
jgi:hypothetical protein